MSTNSSSNNDGNSSSNSMADTTAPINTLPSDLKMNMDEDAEEITRKVAVAPSMSVMPSFMPVPAVTNPNSSMMIRTSPTTKAAPSSVTVAPSTSSSSSSATQPFLWQLNEVPTLPEFHPLEQTAAFVPNSASDPSIVAERISSILRERSIEAHYNDSKAKVKCTTINGVEFRIRLYRGRGEKYDHGIIVEIQRRFGTSLCFYEVIRSILDGAQGKPAAKKNGVVPPAATTCLPQVSGAIDDEDGDEDDADINADSSLAMVANMMKLPGFDSQYLGLQILSSLVDAEKLSSSTARAVATKLFEQPNGSNEVGVKVFGYIVNHRSTEELDGGDKNRAILRNMCLTILANSLRAYNGGALPADFDPDREQALRRVLVQDLIHAKQHPNTALLAAKCMEYLLSSSSADCGNAFAIAQQVGKESNANLFRQVEKCMIKIQ